MKTTSNIENFQRTASKDSPGKRCFLIFCRAFFGIALLSWQSCGLTEGDKDVIIQVQDEFSVNMLETLENDRQLTLELFSVELEPCLNSTIDRAVIANNDKVTLLLNGIIPATDCNPGLAPAFSVGNAGILENGTYDFLIGIRNTIENEGQLIVRSDRYEINMLSSDGIIIENKVMYRIPDNTIWGYYAYDDETLAGSTPDSFINDLDSLVQITQLTTGFYGQFTINANMDLALKEAPEKEHIGTFFYTFEGDDNDLTNLLETYRNGPASGHVEFTIFTADGREL